MKTDKENNMKCPHCKSTSIEYYPDVDGASWVNHIYVQKNGEWKIKVTMDKYKNGKLIEGANAATITTGDIFSNDYNSYMYCSGCTAEFHGRDGE